MGAVSFSIDVELIKVLRMMISFDAFVETGTFKGDTVDSIKDLFGSIYSVELSEKYYEEAMNRFLGIEHIRLYQGESSEVLHDVATALRDQSVLYFLDAHWCVANSTAGELSQCPLLGEIEAINQLNEKSLVIIDDARLFLAPPLAPHEISQWPSFDEVLIQLRKLSPSHCIMVLNDTIIFYPKRLEHALQDYGQRHGTDWLDVLHKVRDYDNLREQFNGLLQQLHERDEALKKFSRGGFISRFFRS